MVDMSERKSKIIVQDGWLLEALRPWGVISLREAVRAHRFGRLVLFVSGAVPGLRFLPWLIGSQECNTILTSLSAPGFRVFLILKCLFGWGSQHLYVVEFRQAQRKGVINRIRDSVRDAVMGWAFRRALTGAAVSTEWEIDAYAQSLRVARDKFFHIPFQMSWDQVDRRDAFEEIRKENQTVLASGRSSCDWPTLFAAAEGASWDLTVVCSKKDLREVRRLNRDGRVRVLSEISGSEHARLLRSAAVYALCLIEENVSAGQVRLTRAIDAGVPVVASEVRGLDGYLQDGINALVIPVGDSVNLRRCIDDLMSDPIRRSRLRISAYESARTYTLAKRISDIAAFSLAARS